MQAARHGTLNDHPGNAQLEQVCALQTADRRLLELAMEALQLSSRAWHRILKVTRFIADLAGADEVNAEHVSEALQYRADPGAR